MAKKKKENVSNGFETIESSLSRTEQFIENNQRKLVIGLVVVLAIVAIVMGYKKFIVAPAEDEAKMQIYVAQQYFERDSFDLAVNGDGEYMGFVEIVDDYGSTKTGNLANLYAGICYNKLGEYDNAIDYLTSFTSSSKMFGPIAFGNIGDAYSEKGQTDKAAEYYQKAADADENELTAPIFLMKLGRAFERMENWEQALKAYERIKIDYKETQEGRSIDKFITRVNLNLNK